MIVFRGGLVHELKDASERKVQSKQKSKVDAAMANKIVEMYNDDRTYKEIAAECGISMTTARRTIDNLRRREEAPSEDFKTADREAKEE